MKLERLQLLIQGQVQGVGFRPHIYRVAKQLCLTGWIQNNAAGVLIEIQGVLTYEFITQLKANLPPLAKIKDIQLKSIPVKAEEALFEIIESKEGKANTIISPDTCVCNECLQELFDPQSRYFEYPFLNCMNCGPRFSIIKILPYDRCHTSMQPFPLCQGCKTDYNNPDNRRYHAQPIACIQCGPQLSIPVKEVAQYILEGGIVAVKGLGGYQIICDAHNEGTLLKLRARKNRNSKPFALMVANSKSAEQIGELNERSRILLESAERPIVLLRKKNTSLPYQIAPGLNYLGIMLPYTPLHYLLFHALSEDIYNDTLFNKLHRLALIVTSANIGGEPLIIDDEQAELGLNVIADKIVSYNRQIITREDDSVMRIINGAPMFIRRSRGYVPTPIELPFSIPSTLAVGGHLKNTFCITRGKEAFVSQHIGSLTNKATIDFFHESLIHLLNFLDVTPERIAHDLHPDFYTTLFAEQSGIPTFSIQHHHAHLASVIAEHGIHQRVLGMALDGYGYGLNGEAWGGELLLLENATFERIGSFYPLLQPGGEIVAREPWRMAASVLHHLGRTKDICKRFTEIAQAQTIHQLLDKKINCNTTTSCGRLFDAASALLGGQCYSQYEGQTAMLLESLVTEFPTVSGGWHIKDNTFNMLPTMKILLDYDDPIAGANLFHGALIAGLTSWIREVCHERDINMVVLSGGCFLNKILAEGLTKSLSKSGIKSLLPQLLPPNDGGISLGQAWIAGIQ